MYDLIIIGGGVAGLSAAMYAGRLNMKTLVLAPEPGGTIILTDTIENWPGIKKITGIELAEKIEEHAGEYGADLKREKATGIKICGTCFEVSTKDGKYNGKTVLFAAGTKHRELEVPGEKKFQNKGVHQCALCDGPFYKDKKVAVVGGGDSAAKEALLLAQYASEVMIIVRDEKLRAEPINLKKISENKKIKVITKTQVTEIIGKNTVTGLKLSNQTLKVSGIFIEIGRIPLSDLAKSIGVKLNKKGEIIIDNASATNIKGVYAAGDVTDTKFKQAITGAGEAVTAAYSAFTYLNETELVCPCGEDID